MTPSVFVVGTIFIDCKGFARQSYHPFARNLGSIQFIHGGVGRNVAENLANLGVPSSLVASIDSTALGREVAERLRMARVNTDYLIEAIKQGMGMWLAILDEKGDLAGSISQMPELALLQTALTSSGREILHPSSHIVLELDLNIEIAQSVIAIAKNRSLPLYGLPGNLEIVLKNRALLNELDCFICNHVEAELLMENGFSGMEIERKLNRLIQYVDRTTLGSMVVTLAENGAVFYDSRTKEAGYQPVFPVDMVDSSGAGDAFFSGTVMGLVRGLALKEAVVCGTKVAGWTVESSENICPDLPLKIKQDPFFVNLGGKIK